jgi:hypothetical protein
MGYAELGIFVVQIIMLAQVIPKLLEGVFVEHKGFNIALACLILKFGFGSFIQILGRFTIFAHEVRGKADANLIADRSIHQTDVLLHASLLAVAYLFL